MDQRQQSVISTEGEIPEGRNNRLEHVHLATA